VFVLQNAATKKKTSRFFRLPFAWAITLFTFRACSVLSYRLFPKHCINGYHFFR